MSHFEQPTAHNQKLAEAFSVAPKWNDERPECHLNAYNDRVMRWSRNSICPRANRGQMLYEGMSGPLRRMVDELVDPLHIGQESGFEYLWLWVNKQLGQTNLYT